MVLVKFTGTDEFLSELALQLRHIDSGIVRVTISWRQALPFTTVRVIASFVTVGGQLVKLDRHVGEYMSADGPDGKEVRERADKIADAIRAEAAKLKLETRAGIFEAVN